MDTLMIALLIASAPVRPTIQHVSHLQAPTEAKPLVVAVASIKEPEMATTCHLNANGTCWSE
jgi:prephenate dehydrogenase